MRSLLWSVGFLAATPVVVHSQAAPSPLSLFAKLVGEWEGEAWIIMGPSGKQVASQRETVEAVAGGTAFTIKGRGTTQQPDGSVRVTHDAFAVVFLDHDRLTPRMRTFVANGANWIDPDFTLTADGYHWSMKDPRAGLIRYEMAFDAEGRWVEKGVMSRDDGKTWMPFFGMTLSRTR